MNRGQKTLLVLIGLTAAPFILAQLAFMYYRDGPDMSSMNKGTFVKPAATIESLQLEALPGPTLPDRKWRLMLYRPANCDQQCQQNEQRVRAMPTLVGREGSRVAAALIVEDARTAAPTGSEGESPLPRFRAGAALPGIRDGVLLVDPHGNVVLWYDAERIGAPLLSDLRFLLKNSSIG